VEKQARFANQKAKIGRRRRVRAIGPAALRANFSAPCGPSRRFLRQAKPAFKA